MIACPSCGRDVDENAWFCPLCAHELKDPTALAADLDVAPAPPPASGDDDFGGADDTVTDEVTNTIAWQRSDDHTGEALIVGDLSADPETEIGVFDGVVSTPDGNTSALRLYAEMSATRLLRPEAVPAVAGDPLDHALTPYEAFVMFAIDGVRTIAEVQQMALLADEELAVTLLTLLDRGLIKIPLPGPRHSVLPEAKPPAAATPTEIVSRPEAPPPAAPAPAPAPATPPPPVSPPVAQPPVAQPPVAQPPVAQPPVAQPPVGKPAVAPPPVAALTPSPPSDVSRRPSLSTSSVTVMRRAPVPTPAAAPAAPHATARERKEGNLKRAKELFEAAKLDRGRGNIVSARMNMKLAIAFDPKNLEYQQLFNELAAAEVPAEQMPRAEHRGAQKLLETANKAESEGDIARAIDCLEKAVRLSPKDAVLLNRLGVVLATKKRDFTRAQELLEAAIEIAPQHPAYVHNLSKVLALAASRGGAAGRGAGKQTFWQRLFGKR